MNDEILNRVRSIIIVINPDGDMLTIPVADETAVITPDGGSEFVKTEVRYITCDGETLRSGAVAYVCTRCQTGPWSGKATIVCFECRHRVCIRCSKTTAEGYYCTTCSTAADRKKHIAWLKSFTE